MDTYMYMYTCVHVCLGPSLLSPMQDLIDRGYGYDISDSFVDDTELVSSLINLYT